MDLKRSRNKDQDEAPDSSDIADESTPAKRRKLDPSQSDLCEQCKNLDLDQSFKEAHEFYKSAREGRSKRKEQLYSGPNDAPMFYADAFLVHNFGDRLSQDPSCALCRFFGRLRVLPGEEKHKLLAFCSSESSNFHLRRLRKKNAWKKVRHTVYMVVMPDLPSIPPQGYGEHWLEKNVPETGAIYLSQVAQCDDKEPPLLDVRELDQTANISLVKEWLAFCRDHHGSPCNPPDDTHPVTHGFRVIDCFADPPVVKSVRWGNTYAALSYVWGSRPEDMSDPVEKAYLISRMTTIYEAADFTVIAAAGPGAGHGLPGVQSTPRNKQPKVTLGIGSTLISTMQDPRHDIVKTDYWTRGWTYQEGVLSNRRVVFTEDQVYWECRCMATHESIRLPIRILHEKCIVDGVETLRMASYMLSGIFKGDTYTGGSDGDQGNLIVHNDEFRLDYGFPNHRHGSIRAQLRGLNEHIRAFSSRNLSHDSDSLAAFLGIVGMYRPTGNIHLHLGIPMWMDDVLGDLTGSYITFALSVCSWYHRSSDKHSMFITEPSRRRPHLPSWTWAGRQGTVTWRAPPSDEHCAIMSDIIEAERLHLLWAADIYLRSTYMPVCVRLLNTYSSDQLLEADSLTLLEIRDPLMLRYYHRQEITGTWEWRRLAGRPGGEQYYAEQLAWDKKWYRIGGRLASVNLSISLTEWQWTAKHESGELISVLVFAAQFPSEGHGRARFLTLRRVAATAFEPRWERVGTLQLTIPAGDLDNCLTNDDLLERIPVRIRRGAVVIQ